LTHHSLTHHSLTHHSLTHHFLTHHSLTHHSLTLNQILPLLISKSLHFGKCHRIGQIILQIIMGQGQNAFQERSIPSIGFGSEVGMQVYTDGLVIKLLQFSAKAQTFIYFFMGKYIVGKTDGLKYARHALPQVGFLRMDDIELFNIRVHYFYNNLCGVVRRDNIEPGTLSGRNSYFLLGPTIIEKFCKKIEYHILGYEKM